MMIEGTRENYTDLPPIQKYEMPANEYVHDDKESYHEEERDMRS